MKNIVEFLPTWDRYMIFGFVAFVVLGLLIFVFNRMKQTSIKSLKGKYDYIRQYEMKLIQYSIVCVIIGGSLILNTVATEFVAQYPTMFFFRLFIIVAVNLILGFTLIKYIEFNYPDKLEKTLHKLRYTPRISPKSGKPMKLLSEEEEDVHLSEGQQVEEDIFSVDYDVWIDEESGYTQIEKYVGNSQAEECPSCHYHTLKVLNEEILQSPTTLEDGRLMKHYKCDVCSYRMKKEFKVAKLESHQMNVPAGKELN